MSRPHARLAAEDTDLMGVLEERLTSLVERHREALKLIEELRAQLNAERAQVELMSRRLQRRDALQEQLRSGVEALLTRVGRVELALAEQTAPSSDD